ITSINSSYSPHNLDLLSTRYTSDKHLCKDDLGSVHPSCASASGLAHFHLAVYNTNPSGGDLIDDIDLRYSTWNLNDLP
ncbi:MAG: hypothetical protein AAFN93_21740, partial [Bacteroidota bacterium]